MGKFWASLLFMFASLLLFSCQKEVNSDLGPQTGGNGQGNSSTSYNPVTAGSWWKYKDTASGNITTTTILNRTKIINGILYSAAVSDISTSDTGWFASPQPNYYTYAKGVSPNTGAFYDILFHYLNDTASVGYSWQYAAGQGNGFTAYIQGTIVERNISMTVAGKTYSNVIHTKLIWTYDIFGTSMDAMAYDYFIARGVGIIKVRSEGLTLLSGFTACSDLIDYQIK